MSAIAEETNIAFAITPVKSFNKDQVLVAAREVVEEFGADYLYKSPIPDSDVCAYTEANDDDEESPSRLVGQVLVRLGVPVDVLIKMEGAWFEIEEDLADRGFRFTVTASGALSAAQRVQDRAVTEIGPGDHTWGAALRAAEEAE